MSRYVSKTFYYLSILFLKIKKTTFLSCMEKECKAIILLKKLIFYLTIQIGIRLFFIMIGQI